MDKQELLKKTVEILSPFETGNLVNFMQHLTMKNAMENPVFVLVFLVIGFYATIKRSKFVLLSLFAAFAIMFLVRFTLPIEPETTMSLSTTLPFAFGGLVICGVLIYFVFIKTE